MGSKCVASSEEDVIRCDECRRWIKPTIEGCEWGKCRKRSGYYTAGDHLCNHGERRKCNGKGVCV